MLEPTALGRRRMQACPEHAKDDARTQQGLGWGDQAGDPKECAGEVGVVGGGGVQPGQVGVDQPDPQGPSARDGGEDQVDTGRNVPRDTTRARSWNQRRGCGALPGSRWRRRASASAAATLMPWP